MSKGLLSEIESDLVSDRPLADVLRKVVLLGGRTDSPELREWASHQLRGFDGVSAEDLPPYRRVSAALYADGFAGFNQFTGLPLPYSALPDAMREALEDEFLIRAGVAELAAWSVQPDSVHFGLPGADVVGRLIDHSSGRPSQRITSVYWSIPPSTFVGVLDQVRTTLTELISELVAAAPGSSNDPTPEQVDQAISVAVHGSKNRVTVHAAASARDLTIPAVAEDTRGWWTRARKVGAVVVGLATVVAAVAAVWVLL